MPCPQKEKIILAVYKELGPAEYAEFEQHVAECVTCRNEIARVAETESFFSRIPRDKAPKIGKKAFVAEKPAFISWRFRWANVAAAIAIPILLTILFVNNYKKPETTPVRSKPITPPVVAEAEKEKPVDSLVSLAAEAGKDLLFNAAGDFIAQGNENDIDLFGVYGPNGYTLYDYGDDESASGAKDDSSESYLDLDFSMEDEELYPFEEQ